MAEENFSVSIDMSAPVTARVEAAERELSGRYSLDTDAYHRLLELYRLLYDLAAASEGVVRFADVRGEALATLTAESLSFDFDREGLALFSKILALSDHFAAAASDDDTVQISVGVTGLWREVQ